MRDIKIRGRFRFGPRGVTVETTEPFQLPGRTRITFLCPVILKPEHDGRPITLTARMYSLDGPPPPDFTPDEVRAASKLVAGELGEPFDDEMPLTPDELEQYMIKFAGGIYVRADVGDGRGPRRFSMARLDHEFPAAAAQFRIAWRQRFDENGWYPTRVTDPAAWEL